MENFKSLFKPKRIKTFLLMTFFPFVQGGYRTSECSFFLLSRFVFRLRHLHICHYSPYLPPKILHNLFFFISPGYYSRTGGHFVCACVNMGCWSATEAFSVNCLRSVPAFAGRFLELNDVYWVLHSTNMFFKVSRYFYDESEFIVASLSPLRGQSFLS